MEKLLNKMERHRVVIVGNESGDWEGLYIDGELKDEMHSLSHYHVLTEIALLDKPIEYFGGTCSDSELEKHGYCFPHLLENLKYE